MSRQFYQHLRAACAAAVLFLAATPAVAQDDDDSSLDDIPHVTMVGTARAEVAPDLATITLGVTSEKPTAAAAAAETAKTAAAVIDAAKAQGVTAVDISTLSVTLTQTFDDVRDKDGRFVGRKPRGFEADTTFAIKLRDLAKAGGMAEALIAKGANRFDGIAFSVEHPEPILQRLTGDAVREARAEAAAATQAAGSRLGRVLRIERPNEEAPQEPVARHARLAAVAPAAMPIEAGTMTFSTTVAVTWAVDAN